MSVPQLETGWRSAFLLTAENAPIDSAIIDSSVALPDSTNRFSIDGDFNRDGLPDRAVVGVYETRQGTRGGFLLVLTRQPGGRWQKALLHSWPGQLLTYVQVHDGDLIWTDCKACDSFATARWADGAYTVDYESCCEIGDDSTPTDTSQAAA